MPIDTLGHDAQEILRRANTFLKSKQKNDQQRQQSLRELTGIERRLSNDIEERTTSYIAQLESEERAQIDNQWEQISSKPHFIEAFQKKQADLQIFENLRQVNGGAYPRNISPVLYVI